MQVSVAEDIYQEGRGGNSLRAQHPPSARICTAHEIEQERNALKAIPGDFAGISSSPNKASAALQGVNA
jgi:hypothetical protein